MPRKTRTICRQPLTTGESAEAADACRLNPASAPANQVQGQTIGGTKKPQHCPETAVRFLLHNLDTIGTLVAGIWATHVAWCRAGAATPGMETLGRPERCIGPLLILFAVLRFAVAP